jgi:hypothetical protein
MARIEWNQMIKEQVLILKVKYDDSYNQTPHTWNWTELLGSEHEVEVMNHSSCSEVKDANMSVRS